MTLPAASPAMGADEECASLAVAPFGDPDNAVGQARVAPDSSVCYTVTVASPGLYLAPALDSDGNKMTRELLSTDGSQVDCSGDTYATHDMCTVSAAGTYTLKVSNTGWEEKTTSVALVPLASTRGCADAVGTNWDQPEASRSTASPVEVDCQPFEGKRGDRIRLTYGSKTYGDSLAWITDESGARICERFPEDNEDSCVLPGDGPYRVISTVWRAENGFPAEYSVKVRRVSDPQGCTAAPIRPYGPLEQQDFVVNPCFTFTAEEAGPYTVHSVSEDRTVDVARVYDAAGLSVCRYGADPCRIKSPGTYTAVLDGTNPFRETRAGVVVLDRSSDSGCQKAETDLYRGEFTTVGEYDCLTLDAPNGARIAALKPLSASGVSAEVEILDRDGAVQCGAADLSAGTCALSGEAPYRALMHTTAGGANATGPYSIAFSRTDAANDCAVLPAGSFTADGAKATLTTGDGVFSHCLSVPASAHTKSELFHLTADSGGVTAKFSVLDATGKKVCERSATTDGWTLCSLTPGVAHTVLVTGRDQTATYTLARRDVTSTASSAGCEKVAASKVGGPSVPGIYGAPGTLNCHQVTTDAVTDVIHLDVRDTLGTANIVVFGSDGATECSFRNRSCAVTGSATHQVVVQTPATLKAAPDYHLDALRIATADGPAPECTKVPSVSYGYGPITGTLDESHSAVCAVLPTAGLDRFNTTITDTTGAGTTAVPALYNSTWSNGCTLSSSGSSCAVGGSSSAASPTVFVLGLPEKASRTAYSAQLTCSSALCGTDKVSVTAVSPDTGASGSRTTLTVTGTALPANATVRLTRGGETLTATTQSVSADNRTLKAVLDLAGVTVGTWNVSVLTTCCEYARGTFTVTAATK
ncbi:Tat pathway signal protein [Streptomyces sp. NPDC002952]|uniref:Tat pathway signal protein n=1 Tax=Streptomyces sp. NPDC002952 TaxID=3364673 RepID=UPI0036BD0F5C